MKKKNWIRGGVVLFWAAAFFGYIVYPILSKGAAAKAELREFNSQLERLAGSGSSEKP